MVTCLLDHPLAFGAAMLLIAAGFAWAVERAERRYDRKDDE